MDLKKPKTVAIIPARGGSKGIPRKNVRLLAGKPLICYAIERALESKYIDTVVVSTEDEEIAEIAGIYGAEVVLRPEELAEDDTTIDPVIYHAVNSIEEKYGLQCDIIVTIQPTSPLLSRETIDSGISFMLNHDYDTIISVKDETHLYWGKKHGKITPLYSERKNRQYLDPIYKETGALLISKRDAVTANSRIGKKIFLLEIPDDECIDIDVYRDWWVAENLLKKSNVVFRVDGDREIGLGHVYRSITLANHIFNSNIFFLMNANKNIGIKKVMEYNYTVITFMNETELFNKIEEIKPDIIISDVLDTDKEHISKLNELGAFTVNFEDLGEGSEMADIVINALYENSDPPRYHYYGYKYECLRDEFYFYPQKNVNNEVKNILITFGGSDPNNLTLRTIKAIEKLKLKSVYITVILGLGYPAKEEVQSYIQNLKRDGFNIEAKENVKMMAKYIYNADIAITSNGRTIYEVASFGIPCISISQNEREVRHLFSHISRGVMNLGIAYNVSEGDIASAIKKLVDKYKLRNEMSERLLRFDVRKGVDRVLRLIFDGYYAWRENGRID